MRNSPCATREDELAARLKVFKLKFQWYLEHGYVSLSTPRFAVPKAGDIRVVWDCKVNGLNRTLWAPSFMLPTFQDAEDMVVKWLPKPVGDYLDAGSPVIDYTEEGTKFIPTVQGDIDVGAMF